MGFRAIVSPAFHHARVATPRRRSPAQNHFRLLAATLGYVRAAHQHQRRFDVPPGFGFLVIAFLLEGTSLLCGLDNCHVTMRLQQLPRVVLDFDFSHFHGIPLLFFAANKFQTIVRLAEFKPNP
jgi:hypothetical protein